ncbi:hypothetical protein QZH41_011494, partial [Actinostola sp. cb2023]
MSRHHEVLGEELGEYYRKASEDGMGSSTTNRKAAIERVRKLSQKTLDKTRKKSARSDKSNKKKKLDEVLEAMPEMIRLASTAAKDHSRALKKWTKGMGKPLAEAYGEANYAMAHIEWLSEEARRVYGDIIPTPLPGRRLMVIKQPIGTCGGNLDSLELSIRDDNKGGCCCSCCRMYSDNQTIRRNTTVCLSFTAGQLANEAGFSPGVINTLPCSRDHAEGLTDVVLKSDLVSKLSFTGSVATGKLLMYKCVDTVKKVSLELGGNAAFIVFSSADIDHAVKGVIASKHRNTGQACVAPNRILVQDVIYDEFADRLSEAMDRHLKVGNGLDASSTQGPLINDKAVEKVQIWFIINKLRKSAR